MSELQRRVSEPPSRLVTIIVIGILLLIATAPMAMAKSINLLGPQTFVREEGKPQLIHSSFVLPPNVSQCQLLVNTSDGSPLSANNVSIKINGVEMVDAKKLRKAEGSVSEGVELKALNSLEIELKGKPGDAVTIAVTGTVPDVPTPPKPPTPQLPPPGGMAPPRPPVM